MAQPLHSFQRGMQREALHTPAHSPPVPAYTWQDSWRPAAPSTKPVLLFGSDVAARTDHPATIPSENEAEEMLSPSASLYRTLLAQKRIADGEAAADAAALLAASARVVSASAPASSFLGAATTADPFASFTTAEPALLHPSAANMLPPPRPPPCAVHAPAPLPTVVRDDASRCCLGKTLARQSWWNTRCTCIFSALPDELLLFSVFSLLGAGELARLGTVCTRWRFLAADRMLWRRVDLAPHARTLDAPVLDNLMARVGRHAESVKLCNSKLLDNNALRRLGESHLQGNNVLRELHFCSLKAVDLPVLSSLFASGVGSSLRELSLFGCVNVDDACVQLIRASCGRLEELSLRGCLKITDEAFIEPEAEMMEDSVSPDGALSSITPPSEVSLAPMDLSTSLRTSPSFDVVSPADSFALPDPLASAGAIPRGSFAHLTSLNLANCKLLTPAGLVAAFRASPALVKLNLHALNPSDALMDALSLACPLLEQLHLSSANPFLGNGALSDAGVALLAARLPRMRQLNLQGSSNITDACIAGLVQRMPDLERLNLGGCFKLTDSAVRALCGLPAEEGEPAAAAAAVPEYNPPRLSHLSLFQCARVSDASVSLLAAHMPTLQHLDLHSCAALSDRALELLAAPVDEAAAKEEALLVREHHRPSASLDDDEFATRASRAGAAAAPHALPLLQSLDVGSCRKLTAEAVTALRHARPELIVTHY